MGTMRYATLADLKEIHRLMQAHEELRHVRQDKLKKRIEEGQCIYEDGVAITFQKYKKRTRVGEVDIPAGAVMLHQIVNGSQGNGKGSVVFEDFVAQVVLPSGGDLYLSVREANAVACAFYERHGMKVAGKIAWSGGTLPGLVYKLTVTIS